MKICFHQVPVGTVLILMLLTIDGRVAYADNPPPAPSTIAAVNIDPDNAGALGDAAKALSSSLTSEAPKDYDHAAKITFWEVSPDKAGHQAITTEAIKHWTTYVQQGGCLLVGFDQKNSNDVMRLEPFLPVIPGASRAILWPKPSCRGQPQAFSPHQRNRGWRCLITILCARG